jgi:protein O-mannosyl-transferase
MASARPPATSVLPPTALAERKVLAAGAVIVLAALAVYGNSFAGPFVYDDLSATTGNPTIRHLWPIWTSLHPPPGGYVVSGRPVTNFSFAVSHALSGPAVWGYHVLNLAIHALAGLTLFGVVRRTLLLPSRRGRFDAAALPMAAVAALLWTVHPLQTESVTYVSQRTESLVGWFYLLTLYAFLRGVGAPRAGPWHAVAVGTCLLGMATKEVMATAPLMVLFFDRSFVSGSFRDAWRRHRRCYLGLAATWLLLAWLVAGTGGNRGGTVGFGVGVAWWKYGLTQFEAIARYLGLAVWPHPLVFDYGTFWVTGAGPVAPYALLVGSLVAGTLIALWRWPAAGFLGAWFLGVLAPSSLAPGTVQMVVEHRMYLSLAAVIVAEVLVLHAWAGRRAVLLLAVLVPALGLLTARRNEDYRSEAAIWGDTVAKRPANARAQYNLGLALARAGRVPEASAHYAEAVRLKPDYAEAQNNLANGLAQMGRPAEALAHYQAALRLRPDFAAAHYNLAVTLTELDRGAEAIPHFEQALRAPGLPDQATIHRDFANALLQVGRLPNAGAEYEAAVRLRPGFVGARVNLGAVLAKLGRTEEAVRQYQEALRLEPASAAAHYDLGNLLLALGRTEEAIPQFRAAVAAQPDFAWARGNLAFALLRAGRAPEAIAQYREALRLLPGSADMHRGLADALAAAGQGSEAAAQYEVALRLRPDDPAARAGLDRLRSR